MSKFNKFLDFIFSRWVLNKLVAYFLLIIFLIIFHNFVSIIILTFIFWYIFYSVSKYFKQKADFLFEKYFSHKTSHILKKFFSLNFMIISVYLIFILWIAIIFSRMIPKLIFELNHLPQTFPFIADYVNEILDKLREIRKFNNELWTTIKQITSSSDFGIFLEVYNRLKVFSIVFFKVILSLFLSFIFLLDREKLWIYLLKVKNSNFSFLHREYKIIFEKVVKSFWVIIKAQATIAFVNTILTAIWLIFIWYLNWAPFPYLLTLSLIVFFAWFIPVLWTFISSVPIILVWYTVYWATWITFALELILLISVIHFIEAYFLNPKIVSKILSLPISMTFIILLFSEELFWIAWLLLWISLFYFIVSLLWDIDKSIEKRKKERNILPEKERLK